MLLGMLVEPLGVVDGHWGAARCRLIGFALGDWLGAALGEALGYWAQCWADTGRRH
jgi:hypothetical protein